ncbi:ubiquitin-ubiquitin ligase [Saccharomycopsis crataegensis]|uniref:HECT-type E3 ubiquitin transferase n=1 Tax=Saccharomycopsis crataegensis TaxID=43959 RepID=A0AAV5QN57_9ASCO|nr:ubiquitin-ubiquitin ligase [Saccharomycopsis crataegensis]
MSIFNGEFKRGRVINLGGSNNSVSKSSILQKTQNQREKRKILKKRDTSARILQKHIRAYLELKEQKSMISKNWLNIYDKKDINSVVYQFSFFHSVESRQNPRDEYERMVKLSSTLDVDRINDFNIKSLFNSLASSFDYYYDSDAMSAKESLIILSNLSGIISTRKIMSIKVDKLFSSFDKNLHDLVNNKEVENIIANLDFVDPMETFKLFKNSHIIRLNSITAQVSKFDFRRLKIEEISDLDKLKLVSNLSALVQQNAHDLESIKCCIDCIMFVLEAVDSRIEQYGGDQINEYIDYQVIKLPNDIYRRLDYIFSKDFLLLILDMIKRKKASAAILPSLYSSLLKLKSEASKDVSNLFIYLYLFGLPESRKLVFNDKEDDDDVMTDDDSNEMNLKNNRVLFEYILDLSEEQLIKNINKDFLEKFFPSLLHKGLTNESILNEKFFTKDLFLFLEIFSYWLVISTDSMIRNLPENGEAEFLTKNQLISFVKFLKNLCLLLTWNNIKIIGLFNGDPIEESKSESSAFGSSAFGSSAFGSSVFGSSSFESSENINAFGGSEASDSEREEKITHRGISFRDYVLIKKLCFRVLNQLNLIDSRLSLLPKGFWKVNDKRLEEQDRLIPIIAEEEESKQMQDESEDQDGDDEQDIEAFTTHFGGRASLQIDKAKGSKSKILLKNQDIEGVFSILNNLPFFISFDNRVRIFQMLISLDRERGRYDVREFNMLNFLTGQPQEGRNTAEIKRDNLLNDAYDAFGKLGDNFKFPLSVKFIDAYGEPEMGIDGGGITKEFLTSVINEGFNNSELSIFQSNSNHLLYPNPNTILNLKFNNKFLEGNNLKHWEATKLRKVEFLGKVIGKCLYEGVLVDVNFVPFFLKKWKSVGKVSTFDDLNDVDPQLYSGLSKLLNLDDEFFEFSDMSFTITERIKFHKPATKVFNVRTAQEEVVEEAINNENLVTIDLIPNGASVSVNNSNKLQFLNSITNFKLNRCINPQIDIFLKGLYQIIPSHWLNMFNPSELQSLISGGEKDIDINDFKANVEYGGYTEHDDTVKYFWECVEEMTAEEHFKLIKFVTSVPRAPLLGFGDLNPKFGIRNPRGGRERLPTAATCVNLLKLPDYGDKRLLKEKLLYVINSEAGFELS